MQHTKIEMDQKAYSFMEFQRAYYAGKADEKDLTEHTTQPFWQSMRLAKRRLDAKGISMDVEIKKDSKSRTVMDEKIKVRHDGYHMVGNKALNVKVKRSFCRNGKKFATIKDREICNLALLKAKVSGEEALCPNCGHVGTIASFVDGCDACDSKFTVQDFEAKISAFALEENTAVKIKDTVFTNARWLGLFLGIFVVMAMTAFVLCVMRLMMGNTAIDIVGAIMGLLMSVTMVPTLFKVLIVLVVLYLFGTIYLVQIYKKTILQEEVLRGPLPNLSVRDFFQNLEYKLRNIHLTDKVEEVSVFARCGLEEAVKSYGDVIECDMTRLKFLGFRQDDDGYRVDAEVQLRLTECVGKRIDTNYEKLQLTLFATPEIVKKSAAALREYKCPGCASSLNILEGGKCAYCGNTFDYSMFGWVIERYQSNKKNTSLYQKIKYFMRISFLLVFGFGLLFPAGIGRENIFQIYEIYQDQAVQLEDIFRGVARPDELYEDVTLKSKLDNLVVRKFEYRVKDAANIMDSYCAYLENEGFVLESRTEDSVTYARPFSLYAAGVEDPGNYRVIVTKKPEQITVIERLGSPSDE